MNILDFYNASGRFLRGANDMFFIAERTRKVNNDVYVSLGRLAAISGYLGCLQVLSNLSVVYGPISLLPLSVPVITNIRSLIRMYRSEKMLEKITEKCKEEIRQEWMREWDKILRNGSEIDIKHQE